MLRQAYVTYVCKACNAISFGISLGNDSEICWLRRGCLDQIQTLPLLRISCFDCAQQLEQLEQLEQSSMQ